MEVRRKKDITPKIPAPKIFLIYRPSLNLDGYPADISNSRLDLIRVLMNVNEP